MIRSKVATDDDPALIEQRAYCGSLRDALRAIPGAAPADVADAAAPCRRWSRRPLGFGRWKSER